MKFMNSLKAPSRFWDKSTKIGELNFFFHSTLHVRSSMQVITRNLYEPGMNGEEILLWFFERKEQLKNKIIFLSHF